MVHLSKENNFASLLPKIMQITNVVLLCLLLTSIFVSTEQMIFKYYVFKLWLVCTIFFSVGILITKQSNLSISQKIANYIMIFFCITGLFVMFQFQDFFSTSYAIGYLIVLAVLGHFCYHRWLFLAMKYRRDISWKWVIFLRNQIKKNLLSAVSVSSALPYYLLFHLWLTKQKKPPAQTLRHCWKHCTGFELPIIFMQQVWLSLQLFVVIFWFPVLKIIKTIDRSKRYK